MSEQELVVQKMETPAEMIRVALINGANLDQVEKLLLLQERFEANEARKAYHQAMSDFKATPLKIEKDKTVKYLNVKYNHASLANVVEKITIELSKHGLSASWRTQQNEKVIVSCRITHVLGHSEETSLSADADTSGSKNSIQAIGSTISYLERYTLLAILGLTSSEMDDDGQSAVNQEKIGNEEVENIRKKLLEVDAKEEKFLQYMAIGKLEDMLKSDYPKALVALEAKRNTKVEK